MNKRLKIIVIALIASIGIPLLGYGIVTLIKRSKEKEIWKVALEKGTISSIEEYVNQNPKSHYINEAEAKLKELLTLDSLEWSNVLQSQESSMAEKYIEVMKPLDGKHLSEAQTLIDSLDWLSIQFSSNLQDFADYIKDHPKSAFNESAKEKIKRHIGTDEESILQAYVKSYIDDYNNKNLDKIMTYYEPTTRVYMTRKDINKADLRVLMENELEYVVSSQTNIDPTSFEISKDLIGNYTINFNCDNTIRKDFNSTKTDDTHAGNRTYFRNIRYNFVLDSNYKIILLTYNILSEQEINVNDDY